MAAAPTQARPAIKRSSARLGAGTLTALAAVTGLAMLLATNQILPATSAHQAELRTWLAARAAGITALVLLAFQVAVGLVLSHPTNKSTWKLSKRLFPWHEHAWVFTLAFVAVHVVALAADRFANVGWLGAVVPGPRIGPFPWRSGRWRSTPSSSQGSPLASPGSCHPDGG